MSLHHVSIQSDRKKDMEIAKKSCHSLEKALFPTVKGSIYLSVNNTSIELPVSVVNPLVDILNNILNGNQPSDGESLTTQQAANLLNVSRPFLVKLIDSKHLPAYMVGRNRRVYKSDLLAYKENSLKERRKILQKLVDEAQELGLGY